MRKLTDRQTQILQQLNSYAYNAMEICRILNGRDPKQFEGCYYQFGLARKGPRCRFKERGCEFCSSSVDGSLRHMQKKRRVRSVKMRWFDGRKKGAFKNSLQLDLFRFYYVTKEGLARKLQDDIQKHLLQGVTA